MGDSCTQGTDNCHEPVARDGSQSEHLSQSVKVSTWLGNVLWRLRVGASGKMPAQKLWALWENRSDTVLFNPMLSWTASIDLWKTLLSLIFHPHITCRVIENEEQRRKQIEIEHNNTRNVVPLLKDYNEDFQKFWKLSILWSKDYNNTQLSKQVSDSYSSNANVSVHHVQLQFLALLP